jgi:hypothetical protein
VPLDAQVLAARIELRIAELRLMAAKQFVRRVSACPPCVVAVRRPDRLSLRLSCGRAAMGDEPHQGSSDWLSLGTYAICTKTSRQLPALP